MKLVLSEVKRDVTDSCCLSKNVCPFSHLAWLSPLSFLFTGALLAAELESGVRISPVTLDLHAVWISYFILPLFKKKSKKKEKRSTTDSDTKTTCLCTKKRSRSRTLKKLAVLNTLSKIKQNKNKFPTSSFFLGAIVTQHFVGFGFISRRLILLHQEKIRSGRQKRVWLLLCRDHQAQPVEGSSACD